MRKVDMNPEDLEEMINVKKDPEDIDVKIEGDEFFEEMNLEKLRHVKQGENICFPIVYVEIIENEEMVADCDYDEGTLDQPSTSRDVLHDSELNMSVEKTNTDRMRVTDKNSEHMSNHEPSFIEHLRRNIDDKSYVCNYCDFRSSSKSSLVPHIRRHTGEKPFSCQYCSYKCIQKSQLVIHERTHTGEKPYMCYLCNRRFSLKAHLLSHKRTHTGEKPFECKLCEHKSSKKSSLVKHIRTHTGEKPFKCSHCPFETGRKFALTRHMKRKHK